MRCLLCQHVMNDGFGTGSTDASGERCPSYVYRCAVCGTVCKDHLTRHASQTWLFSNGSMVYLSPEAMDDADFRHLLFESKSHA